MRRMLSLCLPLAVVLALASPAAALEECRLLRQPDIQGDRIVFSYAGDLWTVARSGGVAARLTSHEGLERFPKFSPDAKTIAFTAEYDGNVDAYSVPAEGGEPARVAGLGTSRPAIAPDGKTVACEHAPTGSRTDRSIVLYPIDGGEAIRALDLPAVSASPFFLWSADGRSMVYLDNRGAFDLFEQPIDGGAPRKVLDAAGARIFSFDISRNGRGFALAMGSETSDAVMISGIR